MGTIGINYISTFGTTLYLKDVSFRNGKIVSFTPTAYFDKDNLIGFNTGIKFLYSLKNNWGVTLGADKYFGDNGSPYSKSDWISIGLGITKRLDLKCKKQN